MDHIDREVLRRLAGRWMELASLPVMAERKRQWTALKDLHAERPMVLFETRTLIDFFSDDELVSTDPFLRGIERRLRWDIRHVEEVGDDLVLEPFWRALWEIKAGDYGVELTTERTADALGGHVAYHYNHPVRTVADVDRLHPRTYEVDRESTLRHVDMLDDLFGDIMPVVLQGTSSFLPSLTGDLFRLIGNDNLLAWTYDAPEALHRIMALLRDDRVAYYRWLEREGLLGLNNGSDLVGSGSPGYTTALPQPDYAGKPRLRDLWVWLESQETTMISPRMFAEFFLPYLADVGRLFGLVYYGCCEPLHDRWDHIIAAIPNIRAVSISPWSDFQVMGAKLGRNYVFSRKPKPFPISQPTPDWDSMRQDIEATWSAARDCNLEIIFRDVYRIYGDRPRLRRWVEMVRATVGA